MAWWQLSEFIYFDRILYDMFDWCGNTIMRLKSGRMTNGEVSLLRKEEEEDTDF